jgi:threonyl-tRNA synthetase
MLCVRVLQVLSDHDRPALEKRIETITKDNQRFQRVVVSREEALGMFQENKFKVGGAHGL